MKQTKEITNGTGVCEPAGDGGHHTDGATGGQDEDGGRHTDGTADVLAASASRVTFEDIRRQAGALGSAGKALDALFMAPQPSGPTPGGPMPTAVKPTPVLPSNGPSYNPSNMGYGDPRTILTLKSGGQKVVHITQFLTESTKKRLRGRRQGMVLGTGGDDNVVIRTEDGHPYRGVTISEWGAANARLMAHLLQTGALRKEDVKHYLAYTTQIFEYASVYEWEAVLEFDFIFRQRQAVHGFLWGQIPPYMQMSLVSRPRTTGVRQRVNDARFNQPLTQRQGSSGSQQKSSEPCWQFLAKNSNCPFGDRCRFSHTNLPPHRNAAKKTQPASAPTVSTSLRHEAWSEMLPSNFPGRENLLFDIRNSFDVINSPVDSSNYIETNNYRSATNRQARPYVEGQILDELSHDCYGIAATRPHIVSALDALAKNPEKTKFRLIHDASRPQGQSLNDLAINEPFKYQTIQDAVNRVRPGYWLAKVDLSNAYRAVGIHPSNYSATGIKWQFSGDTKVTYMYDKRLCFGGRRSPAIFNKLFNAVYSIMYARGFDNLVNYCDDWLVISQTMEECRKTVLELIHVLRKLGFQINYGKVEGPCKSLTFLGIHFNTDTMTLALPSGKLMELKSLLCVSIERQKLSRKELQSLIGKLNWASQVIYDGRFFMRRLIERVNSLERPLHRTRIDVWNGTMPMVDNRPGVPLSTDACRLASGAYFNGVWIYTPWVGAWPEAVKELHINYKEVLALEPAVVAWGHLWCNRKVYIHCDNQAAVAIINKGTSKNSLVMESLRRIYWASAVFNFRLKAVY